MNRRIGIAGLVALAGASIVATAAPSSAGGFCGEGNFTDSSTTDIALENMCFSPTVARVDPGDTVTFHNKDKAPHAVGGVTNIFGDLHTELAPGKSISYKFDEEGVYPYVCILHPGMAGAIVVGDGEGKASAAGVSLVPPAESEPEAASAPEQKTTRAAGYGWVLPLAVVLGIAVLALAAIPMKRRSKTQVI